MKALIQTDYGDPARVLELRDVPDETPGPGEVVIGMEAAVVHIADVHTVTGHAAFRKKLPRTPGYEGIGRIVAVGEGVTDLAVGDRVFPPLGSGTHREQVRVRAEDVVPAPEGEPEQLALLALNPATALLMLQDFVELAEGDWVIQNAANSIVGRFVIELANDMGIRTVNVVKSEPIIQELREHGAGVILLDDADLAERVAAATQGAPIRLGLDAVGGPATAWLARCLADGAVLVNYGAMSGQPCHMPSDVMVSRDVKLCGINPARQLARHDAAERRAIYERLGEMIAAGRLNAKIAATYPLDKAVAAFLHAARTGDKRYGKVVIRIA